jgi:hypothetical protein
MAIGATAPLIFSLINSNNSLKRPIFIAWNLLGITDLLVAVTLGILNSATSFGILAGSTTTALMSEFPRNVIPTFLVPLFIIVHMVALDKRREVQAVSSRAAEAVAK